ncbi:MAG TPA: F0F1 ATP synthase subunit epsilon [Saprospiraceae bacterium]|nr:F0F1 ATP synthase subunit epsilon [Saprospiraceae bacterium]
MHITVLTPNREIFRGRIESVKLPGVDGEFQVLNNHAPIVSALDEGKVTIVTSTGVHRYFDEESGSIKEEETAGKKLIYRVNGGFIEVLNNEVSLLLSGLKVAAA